MMIQYIEIRGTDRKIIGTIANFNSVIWQTEYNGTGSFEIVVPYTEERFNWLQPDNYITRVDSTEIGFIESVKMSWTIGESRKLIVSGRFGLVLLERRLFSDFLGERHTVANIELLSSQFSAGEMARQIVYETLSNFASWTRRRISWLNLILPADIPDVDAYRSYYSQTENALNLTRQILNEAGGLTTPNPLGQRIAFNRSDLTATYEVYQGNKLDLIFSQKYKNLISFDYSFDTKLYKTGFLIKGDDDGASISEGFNIPYYTYLDRKGESKYYEKRREFLFESDVNKKYLDENETEHTYSNSDYSALLRGDCQAHFAENFTCKTISGTVNLSAYKLGVDYNVGDTVIIKDDETLINSRVRIWSVTEIQDKGGYRVEADFEGDSK